MESAWEQAQAWEYNWWKGVFQNTLNEELKQLVYAEKMGLKFAPDDYSPYWIDFEGKSVYDIGCGASSMLFKGKNIKQAYALDPLFDKYPEWIKLRYKEAKINVLCGKAEEVAPGGQIDLILIYNVLQHTEDPEKIIAYARKIAKEIRIFEWIETGKSHGHPVVLTEENLNKWLGGEGKVEFINKNNAVGKAYFGIFNGI